MKKILRFTAFSLVTALISCGQTPDTDSSTPQTPNFTPQIVGGVESKPHSHPYSTMLKLPITDNNGDKKFLLCGGVLISKEWVMTAAHCAEKWKPEEFIVRVGVHNHLTDPPEGEKLSVIKRIIHPKVNTKAIWKTGYDIALLKLNKPVSDPNAKPIDLPSDRIDSILNQHNARAIVMGWGFTVDGGKSSSPVLRETNLPISPSATCRHPIDKDPLYKPANTICGLPEDGKSSCRGDSGSPIIQTYQGKKYVLGMPSYGYACGDGYSGFTRVNAHTAWIKKHTGIDAEAQDTKYKPLFIGSHRYMSSKSAIVSYFSKRKRDKVLPKKTKTILIRTANMGKDANKLVFRMIVSNKQNKRICDVVVRGDTKTFCRVNIKDTDGLKIIHQSRNKASSYLTFSYFAETK